MRTPPFVLASLMVLLSFGCDDAPASTDAGVDAATRTDGGGTDAGAGTDSGAGDDAGTAGDAGDTGDAGPVGVCGYVSTLDRTCSTDADCAVGLHQTDCCGNSEMIGFRTTEQTTYATSESACQASYPICDCPVTLPTTDSGETVTDTSAVNAACVARGPTMVCLTYISSRPAGTP